MRTRCKNIHLTKRKKMKKLLITLLSITTIFAPFQVAQAADEPVIAIIDTAIDSKKVTSVIYEACFTQNRSCPNKTNFMEGSGSANSNLWPTSMLNATYHGHHMVSAALQTNPNMKVVFVRIANITDAGNSTNTPQALSQAIDWVSKNASRFSVDAVSISQSSISANNLKSCTTDSVVINGITSLNNQNIPSFIATGNDGKKDLVGFPSCVNGAIGVGAATPSGIIAPLTNSGPGLDVLSVASMDIVRYNGTTATITGTSLSTVVAASLYVKNKTTNVLDFISQFSKILTYPFIR